MSSPIPAPSVTRAAIARDVSIQLVGRVVNLAIGTVVTVLIVRELGVDGNGEWTTMLAGLAIVGIIGELGMESVAVRKAAADPAETANWLGALLVMRVATSIPAALLAVLLAVLQFHSGEFRLAGMLIAANIVAGAPGSLRAGFQLQVRNGRSIVVMTANSVFWTTAVVLVIALHGGVAAFAVALVVTTAMSSALQVAWVARGTKIALRGARRHGRELVTVGVVVGVGSALTFAYGRVDQILVLHYTGLRGAGIYGTAYMLLDRVQFMPAAIMTTAFPLLSAAWPADPVRMRRLVQKVVEAMALISVPALAFTLVASRPTIELLFGKQFDASAAVLPVLMLAFVSTCFGYLVGFLAVIVNRQRTFIRISLVALVFNVAANVVLLPRYGYLAAAWVTVATEVVVITQAVRVALAPLNMKLKPGRFPNAILAAGVMALIVELCVRLGVPAIGLLAVAAVAYPVAVLLCGGLSPEDRELVVNKLRGR